MRAPASRSDSGSAAASRLAAVSVRRWLLVVLAFMLWGVGMYVLIGGSYALGGGLIVMGGLCLVIAASGGWSEFVEGVSNWLYFWR